jgi:hypothetical protein
MHFDEADDRPTRGQFDLSSLLIVVLACGMTLASMRFFRFQAFSLEGIVAGIVLATIGAISGSIFGSVSGARQLALFASGIAFLGVVGGRVHGDRFILWSIACLTTGLLVGLLFSPPRAVEKQPADQNDDADEPDEQWDNERWDAADWR